MKTGENDLDALVSKLEAELAGIAGDLAAQSQKTQKLREQWWRLKDELDDARARRDEWNGASTKSVKEAA